MSKPNDGGPAFPMAVTNHTLESVGVCGYEVEPGGTIQFTGMSLRNYYMAHVEVPDDLPMSWGEYWVGPWPQDDFQAQRRWWVEVFAKYKAVHADAMIKEGLSK